jgi:hypothetical protein
MTPKALKLPSSVYKVNCRSCYLLAEAFFKTRLPYKDTFECHYDATLPNTDTGSCHMMTRIIILTFAELIWLKRIFWLYVVYSFLFQCPIDSTGGIYQTLNKRRGIAGVETTIIGTPLKNVKCYLPVNESFGMYLRCCGEPMVLAIGHFRT